MFVTILAHIIVALGVAALAALIVYVAYISTKMILKKLKERLANKVGGKCLIISAKKVADEALKEAEKKGNIRTIEQLEAMANNEGIIIAQADENNNIIDGSIEMMQAEKMDPEVNEWMGNEGYAAITA